MGGFRWHPEARLFGPSGAEVVASAAGSPVPDGRDPGAAVSAIFSGQPFRIGAPDQPSPRAGFETLTGGTTGAQRRVARSFDSWITSFAVNAGQFGIGPGSRIAVLGQLSHSLALYGLVEALHLGAQAHVLAGLRPDRQLQALALRKINVLWATPPQLRLLCACSAPVLPEIRRVLTGGAKLDSATRAGLQRLCPQADLREFYGAAEASFIAISDAGTPDHAVGRPYPGVEICIGAPGSGQDNEGQIWVRSPYIAEGYGDGLPGSAVWRQGWLGLGDAGRFEDGQLVILGRIDRMVSIAAQNVFPDAMEAFALGLPGVADAALLPVHDDLRGQVLVAVLRGDPGAEAQILAAMRARFGVLAAPRRIIWRADWPQLGSGKTDLAALAAGVHA